MRSTDDQLGEVVRRSSRLRRRVGLRRSMLLDSLGACVCLALMVVVQAILAGRTPAAGMSVTESAYGSLVINDALSGLVAICVLSFALGVCVTLLVMHLRAYRQDG